jgi:hypothetical protein
VPSSPAPGSVELAVATRREVYDPRRRMAVRRAWGWALVGLGSGTLAASLLLTHIGSAVISPMFLLFLGAVAAVIGLARVDTALAELRRYDRHVKPLPRARLRLRIPPS